VIWACSNNPASFWGADHRERIGWQPQDSAEAFRAEVGQIVSNDPVEERYQGGGYCSAGYSRNQPSPRDPFDPDDSRPAIHAPVHAGGDRRPD
jgi:uronate dehydrogenase